MVSQVAAADGHSLAAGLQVFVDAFLALLAEAPDSGNPEIENERRLFHGLLSDLSAPVVVQEPVPLQVSRFLETAHADPGGDPHRAVMMSASARIADRAVWRNKYAHDPDRRDLFRNFGFCDFAGPDGWQDSQTVTLGLVLLGPDTYYPFHEHAARELYYLLSGTSDWAVDLGRFQTREPGAWLLHKEMQPHAMRSGSKPMLAISAWRGDIRSRSRFTVQTKKE